MDDQAICESVNRIAALELTWTARINVDVDSESGVMKQCVSWQRGNVFKAMAKKFCQIAGTDART